MEVRQEEAEGAWKAELGRGELSCSPGRNSLAGFLERSSGKTMLQVMNPAVGTPVSGETHAPGAQAPLVLVSLGNHTQSFHAGMCEGCRKVQAKFLGTLGEKPSAGFTERG